MVESAADLTQLKGVGAVLAKRLVVAGLDSFQKIADSGAAGLTRVPGISPARIEAIVEQARQLAQTEHHEEPARAEALQQRLADVKGRLQSLAEQARERFGDQLAGKRGKRLATDLVRIHDALGRLGDGGKKRAKRAGKALGKAEKRFAGLEDASLKKVHKKLKKARKTVLKAL